MQAIRCLASIICLLALYSYCSAMFIDRLCGFDSPKVEARLPLKVDFIHTEPAFVATFDTDCGKIRRVKTCTVFEKDDLENPVGEATIGASAAYADAAVKSKAGVDYTLTCYRQSSEPIIRTLKYVPPKPKQTKTATKA